VAVRILRIGPFSFTPRAWPTAGAVAFIALTLFLGRWQMHRAEEKEVRQALLEARVQEAPVVLTGRVDSAEPLLYRHLRAAGVWVPEGQIFIDNQVLDGRAGYHVVTPLELADGGPSVLVNRGWIARGAQYPKPPDVAVPAGRVEVAGLAAVPPRRYLELGAETITGNVWQNLSIERYRSLTGRAVLPVMVLADPAGAGLVAVRDKPDAGVDKHREYEWTWFAFAATTLVLWIALNLKRAR
jgi:surfeit locus 1 family protein